MLRKAHALAVKRSTSGTKYPLPAEEVIRINPSEPPLLGTYTPTAPYVVGPKPDPAPVQRELDLEQVAKGTFNPRA